MINLEALVRPHVSKDIAPPRIVRSSRGVATDGAQSIILSGTPQNGDQLALSVASPAIAGSPVVVSFSLGPSDTLTSAAQGLVDAVNGNAALQVAGISATATPARPQEIIIAQPPSLNPQAIFTGSSTGATVMTLTGGSVVLTPGQRGDVTQFNVSYQLQVSRYTVKQPRETVSSS